MAWSGLALLLLVGLGIIVTGLPAAIILLAALPRSACWCRHRWC